MREKIVSNVFYHALDLGVMSLVGYIFYISMGKLLLPTDYGLLTFILAFFYILNPISILGLGEALANIIPKLLARKPNKIKPTLRYAGRYAFGTAAILTAIIFILSFLVSSFYISFKILSLLLITGAAWYFVRSIMQGFQEFKKMFAIDLVAHSIRIFSAIAFVLLGFAVAGALVGWVLCFLIATILQAIYLRKIIRFKTNETGETKNLLTFGISSAVSISAYWLLLNIGIVFIGLISNLYSVALFGVSIVFGEIILFFSNAFIPALLPNISSLYAKKEFKKIKLLLKLSLKYCLLISLLPALILISFPEKIIKLFYTAEYVPASQIFPYMLIGSILFGLTNIILITLYALGKPKTRIKLAASAVIIETALILSMLYLGFGLIGAAQAFLITQIVFFILSFLVIRKMITIIFDSKNLLIILVSILLYIFAKTLLQDTNLVASILVISILYIILSFFSLKKEDRILFETLPQIMPVKLLKRFLPK